jgi:Ca2+-binding EF-hand superfamily protein
VSPNLNPNYLRARSPKSSPTDPPPYPARYEEIQSAFDDIGDGTFVSVHDLMAAFKEMGVEIQEEEMREMVTEADVDGNGGKISMEDFKYLMETRHKEVN